MKQVSMKQQQINYVMARAEAIFNEKKRPIHKKYETPAKSFSNEEKALALKEGRFTVDLSNVSSDRYSAGWSSAVSFPEEYGAKFDNEGYRAEVKPLLEAYNKLIDELMLGDNAQALELLREFEAK